MRKALSTKAKQAEAKILEEKAEKNARVLALADEKRLALTQS